MDDSEIFLETLKRLRYPLVNECKSSDFESFFSNDLKQVMTAICKLNEDNVLTAEELKEYGSLSYEELSSLEELAQREDLYPSEELEDEKKMELKFLEEHLALIEEHNSSLQRHKDTLRMHKGRLLDEIQDLKALSIDSKRQFATYAVQTVPQAEDELATLLQSIYTLLTKLQSLIVESDYIPELMPPSKVKDVETYFEDEQQISLYIKDFLHKHFGAEGNPENFQLNFADNTDLARQVSILRKVLKESKMAEFAASIENEKSKKVIEFLEKHQDGNSPHIFEISTSQLWNKMEMENKQYENLTKKEDAWKLYLEQSVAKQVDAYCSEIGSARSEEIIKALNLATEKLQVPLDHLIKHRSRLELLLFYLYSCSKNYKSLKHLIDSVSHYIENEQEAFKKRRLCYEEEMAKEVPASSEYLPENSIFLSVYKMLSDIEQQHVSFISMNDVLKKVEQLYTERKSMEKEQDEKFHILTLLEKQRVDIEKFIYKGKEFMHLCEMDSTFNVELNKLDMKIEELLKFFSEKCGFVADKKKLLSRNRYQRLGRELYVHALLDEEYFLKLISSIEKDANNMANLDSSETDAY